MEDRGADHARQSYLPADARRLAISDTDSHPNPYAYARRYAHSDTYPYSYANPCARAGDYVTKPLVCECGRGRDDHGQRYELRGKFTGADSGELPRNGLQFTDAAYSDPAQYRLAIWLIPADYRLQPKHVEAL